MPLNEDTRLDRAPTIDSDPSRAPGSVFAGRTFDAILFDMDGTLLDSVPAVIRAWSRWAVEYDLADPGALTLAHGTPARDIVARHLPSELHEEAYARIVQLETEDNDGVSLLPGTARALADLFDGQMAIVTSCTRALAAARLAASGLSRPSVLVCADDVVRGKPDPAPFLLAAERLGVDPERCLVVEDAPSGLLSARAAGCSTLAVAGTHALAELDADAAVPDLSYINFVPMPDGRIAVHDYSPG